MNGRPMNGSVYKWFAGVLTGLLLLTLGGGGKWVYANIHDNGKCISSLMSDTAVLKMKVDNISKQVNDIHSWMFKLVKGG